MIKFIKFRTPVETEMRIRKFGQEHGLEPRTATTVKMILNRDPESARRAGTPRYAGDAGRHHLGFHRNRGRRSTP